MDQYTIYLDSHFGVSLLGQGRIESMNEAFRAQDSTNTATTIVMLSIIVVALLVAAVSWLVYKRRSERTLSDSARLFEEIGRAHHLSRRQRKLLMTLAKSKKLEDPCMMYLDAELWVLDPANEPNFCKPKIRNQLHHVQRLLFREPKSPTPAAEEPKSARPDAGPLPLRSAPAS